MDTEIKILLEDGWSDDEGGVLTYFFLRKTDGESGYEQMNAHGETDILYYAFTLKTGDYTAKL